MCTQSTLKTPCSNRIYILLFIPSLYLRLCQHAQHSRTQTQMTSKHGSWLFVCLGGWHGYSFVRFSKGCVFSIPHKGCHTFVWQTRKGFDGLNGCFDCLRLQHWRECEIPVYHRQLSAVASWGLSQAKQRGPSCKFCSLENCKSRYQVWCNNFCYPWFNFGYNISAQ